MPLDNYTRILLDLLEEQEVTAAGLYAVYARRFPEHEELWQPLSRDETNHAKWIRTLRVGVESGSITVDRSILRIEELQKFALFLKSSLERSETIDFWSTEALRTAARIEGSFLEQPFTKVFSVQRGKAGALLEKLEKETAAHARKIAGLLERFERERIGQRAPRR